MIPLLKYSTLLIFLLSENEHGSQKGIMQVLKDEIRNKILSVAKKEFLKNGYRKTSLKTIAEQVQITAPTIYCYFKNKDDVFRTLVQPVLTYFEKVEDQYTTTADLFVLNQFRQYEPTQQDYLAHMQFIDEYRDEFKLLFSGSSGSSLENYPDYLMDLYTDVSFRLIELLQRHYPQMPKISRFFIHTMAGMYVNIFREVVQHDVSREELELYTEELITFRRFGWMAITGQIELADNGNVRQVWKY